MDDCLITKSDISTNAKITPLLMPYEKNVIYTLHLNTLGIYYIKVSSANKQCLEGIHLIDIIRMIKFQELCFLNLITRRIKCYYHAFCIKRGLCLSLQHMYMLPIVVFFKKKKLFGTTMIHKLSYIGPWYHRYIPKHARKKPKHCRRRMERRH